MPQIRRFQIPPMPLMSPMFLVLLGLATCGVAQAQSQSQSQSQSQPQSQPQAQDPPRLVEGQPFATRLRLSGTDTVLNGTGVRAVAWFKGYAVGLYLPQRATTAAQAVAQTGPKRLQLRMLQDVPAAEFVKALNKGMERNSTAEEWPTLAPRVQRFGEQIMASGAVHKRDVVDLDFDPARGLLFARNGKLMAEVVPGADFYAALLRAFIGDHPYDERMRAGLLAQPGAGATGN